MEGGESRELRGIRGEGGGPGGGGFGIAARLGGNKLGVSFPFLSFPKREREREEEGDLPPPPGGGFVTAAVEGREIFWIHCGAAQRRWGSLQRGVGLGVFSLHLLLLRVWECEWRSATGKETKRVSFYFISF